jgi:hypothetical protein
MVVRRGDLAHKAVVDILNGLGLLLCGLTKAMLEKSQQKRILWFLMDNSIISVGQINRVQSAVA